MPWIIPFTRPRTKWSWIWHTIMEALPKVHVQHINATLQPLSVQSCQTDEMADHHENDKFCMQVTQNINLPKYKDYKEDNGLLYLKTKVRKPLIWHIVIPSKLQHNVLIAAHENLGHMGISKTCIFATKVCSAWNEETDSKPCQNM